MAIRVLVNMPLVVMIIYDVIRTLTEETVHVSVAAHAGGGFTGITIGMILLKNFKIQKWETLLEWVLGGAFVLTYLVLIIFQFVLY